ncbi:MAG: RodZ domain-containing protein [Candidatus Acidiferrum sp.]
MAKGNFGERLKRERELREVTLQEITSATRIGPRFLEALENEDWEKLPGGVFNRGFVRSIARYLGLDEEAFLGEYDLAHGAQVPATEEPPQHSELPPPKWLPAVLILGALVILAAIVLGGIYTWKHFANRHTAKQYPQVTAPTIPPPSTPVLPAAVRMASSPANASGQSNASPQPASGQLDLFVSVNSATHLLVVADGRVVFYDQVRAAQSFHFTANDGFEVTAANAGAVLLELNGQPTRPLGSAGSFGTIKLNHDDLRQALGGNSQP